VIFWWQARRAGIVTGQLLVIAWVSNPARCQEPCVSLYRVPPAAVDSAAGQPAVPVACRCCPGGGSRSTRARCYPSDMDEREWAVCEPLLPPPAWLSFS